MRRSVWIKWDESQLGGSEKPWNGGRHDDHLFPRGKNTMFPLQGKWRPSNQPKTWTQPSKNLLSIPPALHFNWGCNPQIPCIYAFLNIEDNHDSAEEFSAYCAHISHVPNLFPSKPLLDTKPKLGCLYPEYTLWEICCSASGFLSDSKFCCDLERRRQGECTSRKSSKEWIKAKWCLALPAQLLWMSWTKMILHNSSEEIGAQEMNPKDQSAPKGSWNQFFGRMLMQIQCTRSPEILKPKAAIMVVLNFIFLGDTIQFQIEV